MIDTSEQNVVGLTNKWEGCVLIVHLFAETFEVQNQQIVRFRIQR